MGVGKIPAVPGDNYVWNWPPFSIPLPFWWKHFLWDIGSKFRNKEISGRFSFKWHLVSLLMKGKLYSICWDQTSSHQTPQCNYFPTKYLNEDVNEYQGIWSHYRCLGWGRAPLSLQGPDGSPSKQLLTSVHFVTFIPHSWINEDTSRIYFPQRL